MLFVYLWMIKCAFYCLTSFDFFLGACASVSVQAGAYGHVHGTDRSQQNNVVSFTKL
jgi:hypothetical protein